MIDGQLIPTKNQDVFKTLLNSEKERIIKTIEETDIYSLESGSKFFILSDLTNTNYRKKEGVHAIQGKRYFFFKDVDGFDINMPANKLARLLEGKEWG